MARLLYLGHASVRIVNDAGKVLYIDPYAGNDYKMPCDLFLVTHEHYDHNDVAKLTPGKRMVVIRSRDMQKDGEYFDYSEYGYDVEAVPAYNGKHPKEECVGYLIKTDGVLVYHAGDTGLIPEFKELAGRHIDYALLPIDGIFTMTPEEATEAADEYIKPRALIPIHMKPGMLWDYRQDMKVTSSRAVLVRPGDEILLEKGQ